MPFDVILGSSFGDGSRRRVVDQKLHPGFDRHSLSHDIGLLLLATPVETGPFPTLRRLDPMLEGRSVRLASLRVGSPSASDTRTGTGPKAIIISVEPTRVTIGVRPGQACSGDSGSPAMVDIDGVEHLLGVASFGGSGCEGPLRFTRVDAYLESFIEPYIRAARVARH